jgi:pyridoxine kinase
MSVLSIQSGVSYGRVGNRAAVFALERLGHDVWPIDTVNYSNHPAYGSYKGGVYHAADVAEIIDEIEKRGGFPRCRAVLSGMLGAIETGVVTLDAVERIKRENPEALYALDPVFGDDPKGIYVPPPFVAFYRDNALPAADIATPNAFEAAVLTERAIGSVGAAAVAARELVARGPAIVVVTGVRHDRSVSAVLATRDSAWQATTPWIDGPTHGAGDLFAALFLGQILSGIEPAEALARATSSVYAVLRRQAAAGVDALPLAVAQDELVEASVRADLAKLG